MIDLRPFTHFALTTRQKVVLCDRVLAHAWDEDKHPRAPSGTTTGGQWVSIGADESEKLAQVAQKIYDAWDESCIDEYASGGICHLIAEEMAGKLNEMGIEAATVSATVGEQHVWVVAKTEDGVFSIDIPPGVYERGGGYTWTKIPDVQFTGKHIVVDRIDADPANFEKYLDYAQWDESKHPRHPSGSERGGEFAPSGDLFHVTLTSNVAGIKKKGIQLLQPSHWVKAGDKERYGEGEIFAFEKEIDALRWAARMEWELFQKWGSGQISIVRVKKGAGNWQVDTSDPLSQSSAEGRWLKRLVPVKSKDIVSATVVTEKDLKAAIRKHAQLDAPRLKRRFERMERGSVMEIATAISAAKRTLLDYIRSTFDSKTTSVDWIGKLQIRKWDDVRLAFREMSRMAFTAGRRDVRREVSGATEFADPITPLGAARFMDERIFWISGVLRDDLTKRAQSVLVRALQHGEALDDVVEKLADLFAPYILEGVAPEVVTPFRLETIVRTNLTEAYNTGRLEEMQAPDMAPFIQGIRYSAILDERTTPICEFLHDKVFEKDDPDLGRIEPPNHFNCRSILVPVLAGEDVTFITPEDTAKALDMIKAGFGGNVPEYADTAALPKIYIELKKEITA